jgi:glycosyltransferase involved in cell wall biosynthesis
MVGIVATGFRCLLVVNRVPAGGAEAQLVQLARGLAARGPRVTLCCIDSCGAANDTLAEEGIEVVALGAKTRYGRLAAVPRLARLARGCDVVQCTGWDTSLWGRLAAILARRPVIVADHATDRSMQVSPSGAPRARWIASHNRLLDRFTFATVACARCQLPMLADEGVAPEKTVYIPNGISVDEEIAAGSGLTRADLGLPDPGPLVVQVGRLRREKNPLGGLEVMRQVRAQVPDVQFAFLGDGPMMERVQGAVAESDAGSWAHLLGYRADAAAVIALADVMLLPSRADAMPLAVLESMALGVPVVASDVGDVCRTLAGGGVCVPVDDLEGFRDACVTLLTDTDLRAAAGAAGSERARDFDAPLMVRRYEALFRAACAHASPAAAAAAVAAVAT